MEEEESCAALLPWLHPKFFKWASQVDTVQGAGSEPILLVVALNNHADCLCK